MTMPAAAGLGVAHVAVAPAHPQVGAYVSEGGHSGVFALSLAGEARVANTILYAVIIEAV
jgi:hypothetical protein